MSVPVRLAAFAAVLALAFGAAALAGAAFDPTGDEPVVADGGHNDEVAGGGDSHGEEPAAGGDDGHGGGGDHEAGPAASGLAVADGGYALEVDRRIFSAGKPAPFSFRITDDHGRVVRDEFEVEHDKRLHLIVVRRDTAVFEHVHPRQAEDGTWSVDLDLREPGAYRAYADFQIAGEKRALATDLFVPGEFRPRRLPAPDPADRAAGLDVKLEAPGARAGHETPLSFAVTRGGRPFEALEPYLGAKGHLVALREGDLAYLHVHPTGGASNEIEFAATFPTAGRYRLFLQFRTGGEVRTVAYTLEVPR